MGIEAAYEIGFPAAALGPDDSGERDALGSRPALDSRQEKDHRSPAIEGRTLGGTPGREAPEPEAGASLGAAGAGAAVVLGGEAAGEKGGGRDADGGERHLADDVPARAPHLKKEVLSR